MSRSSRWVIRLPSGHSGRRPGEDNFRGRQQAERKGEQAPFRNCWDAATFDLCALLARMKSLRTFRSQHVIDAAVGAATTSPARLICVHASAQTIAMVQGAVVAVARTSCVRILKRICRTIGGTSVATLVDIAVTYGRPANLEGGSQIWVTLLVPITGVGAVARPFGVWVAAGKACWPRGMHAQSVLADVRRAFDRVHRAGRAIDCKNISRAICRRSGTVFGHIAFTQRRSTHGGDGFKVGGACAISVANIRAIARALGRLISAGCAGGDWRVLA